MSVSDGPVGRRSRVWTVVAGRCSWLLVVVVAVFSVLAVGVTGASAARAKPALRIGETFSGYEFWHDPAAFAAYGREINLEFSTAYAALFHQAPNGQIQPEIATSWQYFATHTGKNKGFEFTIRHNVRFADGSLLTAQSIVGWFNHMYAQHTQASAGYSETFGPNPKFEAVGKWKVKMILSQPNPDVAVTLSDGGPLWGFIASPKCVANPTLFNTQTCGAGPYMLEASGTVAGSHYTYVPNPHYYDKSAIHFSSVTFTVIPSATTMFQALESGQLDLAAQGNTATTVAAAKSAGFAIHTATNSSLVVDLHANGKPVPALANLKVREAINYAIDRKAIASAVGFGYSQPLSEFPTNDATSSKYENYYSYSPSKAKSLLAAAGYPNGFTLSTHATGQELLYLPLIAKYLNAVGITLTSQPFVQANSATYYFGDPVSISEFSFVPTTSAYGQWLAPTSKLNTVGSYPTINKLYNKGLVANNPTADWQKMWGDTVKSAVFAPICTLPIVFESTKSLKGVNITSQRLGTPMVTEMTK